jgi:uncharacterized protein (TIRG00374 family)
MKTLRAILVVGGLAAVAYLIAAAGIDTLLAPVRVLSWRVAVFVMFPYAVVALLRTVAWRLAFVGVPVSLRRLFWVRMAGEALNFAAASVGGEPVKAYLLRPSVPLATASAAQMLDKTAVTVAQVLFLALGLLVALPLFPLAPRFRWAMVALLGVQLLVVTAFLLVQSAGMFGRTLRVLTRFGLRAGATGPEGLIGFDRALTRLYRERGGRALGCTLVHLLGWVTGSLEVYLVLHWLGASPSLATALVVDAFGTGVKFLAFAIPGALGVLEGGYMVVFAAVGLGADLGLSFTLIRRLRMVVWSAFGLIVLALLRPSPRATTTAPARDV